MQRQSRRNVTRRWSAPAGAGVPLARANAVAWARALVTDPATVFLDTETTGFPPTAEIVDIAVVSAAGEVLLDTLVRSSAPIPACVTAIHGIHDQHVVDAPSWNDVHEEMCGALEGRTVVIYNAEFDRRVLVGCSERYQLALPSARWECAMRAYADYRGERDGRSGRPRWHKLEAAARHFGHPPGGHRALADALTCRRVVQGMAGIP